MERVGRKPGWKNEVKHDSNPDGRHIWHLAPVEAAGWHAAIQLVVRRRFGDNLICMKKELYRFGALARTRSDYRGN